MPVLFVTALSDVAEKVRGFEAGGVDYLTKPFHPQEVLARVTAHLQLAFLRRELERKNAELSEEVSLRLEAERQLHQSLDRALVVATAEGHVVFTTLQATQLLTRLFPEEPADRLPVAVLDWVRRPGPRPEELRPQVRIQLFSEPGLNRSFVLLLEDLAWQPKVDRLIALGLTPREAEVLFWFAEGKGAPEIAMIIGVSHNTARKHAQRVLEKLGVENRLAAVRVAREQLARMG